MAAQTIRLYYVLWLITEFGLSMTFVTYALFLKEFGGLGFLGICCMNLFHFTVKACMEVPTGAAADLLGRKFLSVFSCIIIAAASLLYGGSTSIAGFLVAEGIFAIGFACANGAFSAWMRDRVIYFGYTAEQVNPVYIRRDLYTRLTWICSGPLGAWLYTVDPTLPWTSGGLVIGVGAVCRFVLMKEDHTPQRTTPRRKKRGTVKDQWFAFVMHTQLCHRHIQRSQPMKAILLMVLVQNFAVQAPNMFWQLHFSALLGNTVFLGPFFSASSVSMFVGILLCASVRRRIGVRKTLLLIQLVIGFGIAFAGLPYAAVAVSVFLVHEAGRGMFGPVNEAYLNTLIPPRKSSKRATVLSFESMFGHMGSIIGLLFAGVTAELTNSIPTTWLLAGSILVFVTYGLVRLKNK
ncbi:MAG: MFS transporter [Candidatus Kerfeldbacteria bacterium]|nr:MFS transporter [Candidatus Kerfeldbacteria bacterium]